MTSLRLGISLQTMEKTHNNAAQTDEKWMKYALRLAKQAAQRGEVPIGAILVQDNQIIAKAMNRKEEWLTPLGHAELICLHRASQNQKKWRLAGATLYVTLEPCSMCAGALVQARIDRIVFGARDPKGGAVESLYQICDDPRLNHRMQVTGGVLEKECGEILSKFFRNRRQDKKKNKI